MRTFGKGLSYPLEQDIKYAARQDVADIIRNNITDEIQITEILDLLLSLISSKVARGQFQKLHSYYQTINRQQAALYRMIYEEEILSELTQPIEEHFLDQNYNIDPLVNGRIEDINDNIEIIVTGGITSPGPFELQLEEIISYIYRVNNMELFRELKRSFTRLNNYFITISEDKARRYEAEFKMII